MKKILIILCLAFTACSSPKNAEFILRGFPEGVELNNFKEKYDPYNGQYLVSFNFVNNTDKILETASLYADFYIKGEKVRYADGGAAYSLDANGGNGTASVSTMLPKESADSVVFNFNGFFKK